MKGFVLDGIYLMYPVSVPMACPGLQNEHSIDAVSGAKKGWAAFPIRIERERHPRLQILLCLRVGYGLEYQRGE